jgi:hypothetical protein
VVGVLVVIKRGRLGFDVEIVGTHERYEPSEVVVDGKRLKEAVGEGTIIWLEAVEVVARGEEGEVVITTGRQRS